MIDVSRREFMVVGAAGLAAQKQGHGQGAGGSTHWHQRLRRVGQVNFNERDPLELDVKAWAEYWASAKVNAVLINVTGMVAFYPTEVPFHRRSPYLRGSTVAVGRCSRRPASPSSSAPTTS